MLRFQSLVVAAVILLGGCSKSADHSAAGPSALEPAVSGHERMLAMLEAIADETPTSHPYLGRQDLERWKSQAVLADDARLPAFNRWQIWFRLGQSQLNQNQIEAGIASFLKACELLPAVEFPDAPTRARFSNRTRFYLAVAYLRLGETQNCCLQHSSDSCILPIQGEGRHTNQDGSRNAIKTFLEVLRNPTDAPQEQIEVNQPARWLLNIAYMTIGGYPEDVPAEFLVPPAVFASKVPDFPRFKNVYPRLGLDTYNLCGGVIVDDFNNDDYSDIMTCTWDTTGQTQLFLNRRDGTFQERTREANLNGFFGGLNMVQADYDNDGDVDVYIVRGAWLKQAGRHPNSLLRNNGDETFTDVTFEAGLGEHHYPSKTAAWADYDNDGDLDLYVGNEGKTVDFPSQFLRQNQTGPPQDVEFPSQLFRNNGDSTFTDISREAGVQENLFAMGSVWGDYNGDRYPDLFVSVGGADNRLYRNNRDGTFTDVASEAGVTRPQVSFPCWFWDFDNDGNLDLFVGCSSAHVGLLSLSLAGGAAATDEATQTLLQDSGVELMALYRGDGQGGFSDVTREQQLTYPALPMGANFGDLNNDGYLDFYLGTGDIEYSELMPNVMFLNERGKGFVDVTMAGGFGHLQKGHGVAFCDLDCDGDQDVYIQMGGAFLTDKYNDALFENPGFGNHWITVQLVGRQSNTSAIGARIRAEIEEDGASRAVYRHVNSGGSFGCNPLRQTLGLGSSDTIRVLEVYWPTSDQLQRFENVAADQVIRIVEGEREYEQVEVAKATLGGRLP